MCYGAICDGPHGHGETPGPAQVWRDPLAELRFHRGMSDLFEHGPCWLHDYHARIAMQVQAKIRLAEQAELELLVKIYGNVRNASAKRSYVYYSEGKKKYRLDEYLKDRNAYFGSEIAYQEQKRAAKKELDANKKKLRRYIEPPLGRRKLAKYEGWERAQDVFYAWMRRGYQKKYGKDVDIPKLISSQMSEKLRAALKQVRLDYGHEFKAGGFNPRPMKMKGNYRLGTISKHAVGNAIDIDARNNAQITASMWTRILAFTGKSLDKTSRVNKWKSKPEELHNAIKDINDEFVKKLKKAKDDVIAEAKKKAEPAPVKPGAPKEDAATVAKKKAALEKAKAEYEKIKKDPLSYALKADTKLNAIGKQFLNRWKDGFYNLPWALVKELHEEKFIWGATFSSPDIHHFEL